MKITRDNYESFFLDYLEGNLEETRIDQFLDFLEQNPDLKEELHLFETIQLPKEPVVFKEKNQLYKTAEPAMDAFVLKAVAYMEGDLKDQEAKAFKASLARNLARRKEYAMFEKTRLKADTAIQFPDRKKLYHRPGVLVWTNWLGKAAAVLVLLWGVYTLFPNGQEVQVPASSGRVASVKGPEPSHAPATSQQTTEQVKQNRQAIADIKKPQGIDHPVHAKANDKSMEVVNTEEQQRGMVETISPVRPLTARLENEPAQETTLAVSHLTRMQKTNGSRNAMTVDQYLAYRAKKAGNEGILSAHRLLRTGLNVASELSGDRVGYTVKNGKVASLGFESKLLAFEIPLKKK